MRILINHLTRMRNRHVCVAGIRDNGSHIRPVLKGSQLPRALLLSAGGPFSLGIAVDLGPTDPRPNPPEVEDVLFSPGQVKLPRTFAGAEFWNRVGSVARPSLKEIFGDELVRLSGTAAAVPKGTGKASLGVIRIVGGTDLQWRKSYRMDQIRLTFSDPDLGELSLNVNDLRLWKSDHITPAFSSIEAIRTRLQDCLLAVGLTRAHAVSSYRGSWHWLQVNNIFPIGDPLWARE